MAIFDDGSCEGLAGCTSSTFWNYNPLATCDNGTCNPCLGDYNNDSVIDSSDLLAFLSSFGTGPMSFPDLSGDGEVNVADLLIFLSVYGQNCN